MKRKIAVWILVVAVLQPGTLLAQVATQPTTNAAAAAANTVIDTPATPVQIVTGRSTVLEIGVPIMRVSLTNPEIADAMVTSNSQLLLHGKAPGTISMFVWERAGAVRRYDISVGRDVERLNAQMKEMLPNEAVQVTSNGRNVVVSRRELLEEEAAAQAARTWKQLRVDAVMRGTVSSIRDFGAFVDLGGVEGLVHVSELGHGRVEHPSEVLQVGQAVEVMVVRIEPASEGGRTKVALSLRALAPDPWATAAERFPVGATVRGTVRRLERFGAFVEIEPGIDGLVHVSRMALGRRVVHPRDVVAIGDEVEVSVISLDVKERRIGLSLVEAAQQEAAAQEREAMAAVQASEPQSLGTLGDLLARSTKRKE